MRVSKGLGVGGHAPCHGQTSAPASSHPPDSGLDSHHPAQPRGTSAPPHPHPHVLVLELLAPPPRLLQLRLVQLLEAAALALTARVKRACVR